MTANEQASCRCRTEAGLDLAPGDIDALAELHVRGLPDSIFSRLGLGATRCLYRFMARSGQELFVVARNAAGSPVGASIASLSPSTLLARLLAGSSMPFFLLMRFWRLPWRGLLDRQATGASGRPELMFLFVEAGLRSGGVGAALVRRTENAVVSRGAAVLTVLTEDSDSNRALSFYERLGYARENEVRRYGVSFALLGRSLDEETREP